MLTYVMTHNKTLPGHGLLLWTIGQHEVKEELIEVTPNGYLLWSVPFDTLSDMFSWFKKAGYRNYRALRKNHEEIWKNRCLKAKDRRGVDVREGEVKQVPVLEGGLLGGSGTTTPMG